MSTNYAIYPAIGIARVGNAPADLKDSSSFFYGPTTSPDLTDNKHQKIDLEKFLFKNKLGQIKKQAAQFKIYKHEDGEYQEISINSPNTDIAYIKWTVHIANQKASWFSFSNAQDMQALSLPQPFRNPSIEDRASLVVDGRELSLSSHECHKRVEIKADFLNVDLHLGEMFLDSDGSLSILGGNGEAKNINNAPITTFANNDGWIDDISDGTVRATIYFSNGTAPIEVAPAHVVVTPPNYGQGLNGVVTMYDVIQDLFERHNIVEPEQTDFYQHIYPMLKNLGNMQWVNQGFHLAFGRDSEFDFSKVNFLDQLASSEDPKLKEKILKLFRDPDSSELSLAKNPQFYGDTFGDFDYFSNQSLSITKTQYKHLKNWAESKPNITANVDFKKDKFANQPDPLKMTFYHLDSCLGGPFHPGIELTWNLRNLIMWDTNLNHTSHDPYRLRTAPRLTPLSVNYQTTMTPEILLHPQGPLSRTEPGALTRYLGVPWHTDEVSCLSGYDISQYLPMPSYWGPRVPNQVMSAESAEFYRQVKSKITANLADLPSRITSKIPSKLTDLLDQVNSTDLLDQVKSEIASEIKSHTQATSFADKFFNIRQDFYRNFPTNSLIKKTTMIEKWDELGIIAPVTIENEVIFYEKEKHRLEVDPSTLNISEANISLLNYSSAAGMVLKEKSHENMSLPSTSLDDSPHRISSRLLSRDEK